MTPLGTLRVQEGIVFVIASCREQGSSGSRVYRTVSCRADQGQGECQVIVDRVVGIAYARAGLLGNPSDGYGGKAVAICLSDFRARVYLETEAALPVRGSLDKASVLRILDGLQEDFRSLDREDGSCLLMAALHRFVQVLPGAAKIDSESPLFQFSLRFETDIPRQVGLAGSSAIVIACLRVLDEWFGTGLSPQAIASMALAAETEDLGIAAGPMDRIVQAHEGMVVMDLGRPGDLSSHHSMDAECLPALFLAWDPQGGRPSDEAHRDLKRRWQDGNPEVMMAVQAFRELVDEGLRFLALGDLDGFRDAMDQNFDLREKIFSVGQRDKEMVAIARNCGAGAKLCGSGGAVIGLPRSESDFIAIEESYLEAGYRFLRPHVRKPGLKRDSRMDER